MNSTNVITDASGRKVQRYEYSPFGEMAFIENTATAAAASVHKFTGQKEDADAALYYYNARYYDPELGRFIQADSYIQSPYDPQSLNRYSYCRNNPLKFTDPSGNSFWSKLGAALGWVIGAQLGIPFLGAMIGGALGGGASAAQSGQNIAQGISKGAQFGWRYAYAVGTGDYQTAADMLTNSAPYSHNFTWDEALKYGEKTAALFAQTYVLTNFNGQNGSISAGTGGVEGEGTTTISIAKKQNSQLLSLIVANNSAYWELKAAPVKDLRARTLANIFYGKNDVRGWHFQFFYSDGSNSGYLGDDSKSNPIFGTDTGDSNRYSVILGKGSDVSVLKAAESALQIRWQNNPIPYNHPSLLNMSDRDCQTYARLVLAERIKIKNSKNR